MKHRLLHALLGTAALVCASSAGAHEYKIDPNHSTLGFAVPILGGLSKVHGKFTEFIITLKFDENDLPGSSVTATIKAASIDTGIGDRDKHLRSGDFFDIAKTPEITFESSRIERNGNHYVAHGTFTMHGVAKEIDLPFAATGKNFSEGKKGRMVTAGFNIRWSLNRRDYGLLWEHPAEKFVGDVIEVEIDLITKATPLAPPAS